MTARRMLVRLLIGAVLATLPLAVCWGIASLMVNAGQTPETSEATRGWASITLVIGAALSVVAWIGLLQYALTRGRDAWVRGRHERKLNDLRDRGEIDF